MKLVGNWFCSVKSSAAIVATIILVVSSLITLAPAALATQQSGRALEPADMQNLIFVWASGTTSIQQKALQICQADHLSSGSCAGISAEVRSAWLDLMQVDPASFYSPSGNFTDGNWPTALPRGCSESTLASVNKDGITCGGGPNGYNAHNGGWLRRGTFDKGITNQSSIDLSPAVDKALGWTYPSSGLIQVNVSALP